MTEEKLEHIIADLLGLDRVEVCRKLKPLKSELISLVSQNTKITLKGVLEINPVLLDAGTFYNTNTKQLAQVDARVGAKAKIKHHFNIAVKQTRLKNIDLF